jgi:hypothetical protein
VNYHLFHAGILRQKNLLVHTGQNGYLQLLVSKLSQKKRKASVFPLTLPTLILVHTLKLLLAFLDKPLDFCPM